MALLTPYRTLPAERRVALVLHDLKHNRGSRPEYIRRLVARGGGFRAETFKKWPVEQLAREVVRRQLESFPEELTLLQLLYVELEPQYQIAFLDAAGVTHENGLIADDLPVPYTDADGVRRGIAAVRSAFGAEGEHYLQTVALYNGDAWPDMGTLLTADA